MYWSFAYSPMLPKGRIDREALNETMEETRRASSFRSDSAFNDGAGIRSYKYDRVPILAKITSYDLTTGRYSWTQVYSNFDGSYGISEDALDGTPDYLPAYELATNPNVPVDTVVNLIPGDGEFFLFAYPSTLDFGSGSGSICDDILIPERDIRCEDGFNNIYIRAHVLNIADGCLTRSITPWEFEKTEGCCECNDSGSGDDDVESGSGFYGSGGEMLISTSCCPDGVPTTLFADTTFFIEKDCTSSETPFCACDDDTVVLEYGTYAGLFVPGVTSHWQGEKELSCGLILHIELYCSADDDGPVWGIAWALFEGINICSSSTCTLAPGSGISLCPPQEGGTCSPFEFVFCTQNGSGLTDCTPCMHPSGDVYLKIIVGE